MLDENNTKYQECVLEAYWGLENSFKRQIYEYVKDKPKLFKLYLETTGCMLSKASKIPNINTAQKILDIGCGPGVILRYIHSYLNTSADFYGADIEKNTNLADFIKFYKCDIENEDLPFENDSVDIVISTFVLEHLKEPFKLFQEAKRVLRKDGFLYILTEHVRGILLPDYFNFYQDPTHVRPYTKHSLVTLSKITGFEIYLAGIVRINLLPYLFCLPFLPFLDLFLKTKTLPFLMSESIGRQLCLIAKKK